MAENSNYITTEIGNLPSDWDVISLSKIGRFSKGSGITRDQSHSGNIPCVRYGELYTTHDNYIRSFSSYISPEVAKTATRLSEGDILFAGSGETKEEIGKAVAFVGNEEAYAGGDIIILSPKIEASSLFLGFVLNGEESVRQKSSMGQGDAVVHIHAKELANVIIPFPNPSEQRRISATLCEIDSLISDLEKVVFKKRLMKQGSLQQLATGKIRLKGFTSKLQEVSLSEIVDIEKGAQVNGNLLYERGTFPMMNGGIEPSGYLESYNTESHTIIISEGGNSCGYVNYMKSRFWLGGHCYSLIPRSDCSWLSKEYLFQVLKAYQTEIQKLRTGTGLPNIQKNELRRFRIQIADDYDEQVKVGAILKIMDNEIAALEAERDKYKNIKQGMMQKLLTGQIRLPV